MTSTFYILEGSKRKKLMSNFYLRIAFFATNLSETRLEVPTLNPFQATQTLHVKYVFIV